MSKRRPRPKRQMPMPRRSETDTAVIPDTEDPDPDLEDGGPDPIPEDPRTDARMGPVIDWEIERPPAWTRPPQFFAHRLGPQWDNNQAQAQAQRAAPVREREVAPRGFRMNRPQVLNDTQNVHDSAVVSSVAKIATSLPALSEMQLHETVNEMRKSLPEFVDVFDTMERNSLPIMSVGLLESDVVSRVYRQVKDSPESMAMLRERLREIQKEKPCTSGRVAQIVDVVACHKLDEKPSGIVSRSILKQEFMNRAAALSTQTGSIPPKSVFVSTLHDEYVKPGLCSEKDVDAILKEWTGVFDE